MENSVITKKETASHYVHLGVWTLIQIIIWNIPPTGELTPTEMHTLAAFAGLLYGLCIKEKHAGTPFRERRRR